MWWHKRFLFLCAVSLSLFSFIYSTPYGLFNAEILWIFEHKGEEEIETKKTEKAEKKEKILVYLFNGTSISFGLFNTESLCISKIITFFFFFLFLSFFSCLSQFHHQIFNFLFFFQILSLSLVFFLFYFLPQVLIRFFFLPTFIIMFFVVAFLFYQKKLLFLPIILSSNLLSSVENVKPKHLLILK